MNAGVMYEKAKQPEKAADVYLDLAEKYGDKAPDVAEKAAFSAGAVYEKVIYYDRAAKAYELVVDKFGKGEQGRRRAVQRRPAPPGARPERQGDRALQGVREAVTRAQRRARRRVQHRRRLPGRRPRRPRVPGVRRLRADLPLDRQADHRGAHARRPDVAQARPAQAREGGLRDRAEALEARERRRQGRRQDVGRRGSLLRGRADLPRVREGHARRQAERSSTRRSSRRAKLLAEAEKVYLSVVDYQDLKWATAALYRVGQVYDGFAEALANAPTPKGLPQDQSAGVPRRARHVRRDIQDKAVELFSTGYQKAIQMQVYDEYTAKIREALGRLAARQVPAGARGAQQGAHRRSPAEPRIVQEVAR